MTTAVQRQFLGKTERRPTIQLNQTGRQPLHTRWFTSCLRNFPAHRHGKLDWKKLARINVDDVIREVDIPVLQDLLDEVHTHSDSSFTVDVCLRRDAAYVQ